MSSLTTILITQAQKKVLENQDLYKIKKPRNYLPFEEDFDAPFEEPFEADFDAPFELPLDADFAAPFDELLLAAFFAVAMLFEI